MKISFLLFFLSFFAFFQFGSTECGPWIPIDWKTIPLSKSTDVIEVWYLVAPLLECDYNNDFAAISMYHAGLAFVNNASNFSFTINFDANPSFEYAVIPQIITYDNGTTQLKWGNFGALFIYNGINDTYWELRTLVAHMPGDKLNKLITWFPSINTTYIHYDPWAVYTGWPGTVLLPPFECFSLSWIVFDQIHSLGGVFVEGAQANQSIVSLYSLQTPQKVNASDPQEWARIVDFYETVEAKVKNEGVLAFFLSLWEILVDGYAYVRKDEAYYFVQLYDFPYFATHFVSVPLPKN